MDYVQLHVHSFLLRKASSGYQMAKNIIKFIHSISQMIESDELVREYIKVVFIPDYKVTLG